MARRVVQRLGQVHCVGVVAVGEQADVQLERPGRLALGDQVLRQQLRVEVAHPLEADDQHGLLAAQFARPLGHGRQVDRPHCAHGRRQQELRPSASPPIGQAHPLGPAPEGLHGALHLLHAQLVDTGDLPARLSHRQPRVLHRRLVAVGIAQHIHRGRAPVQRAQPFGDDLDLQAGLHCAHGGSETGQPCTNDE